MSEKLKIEWPTQGWTQFVTTRKKLLADYDEAKDRTKSHKVEVFHGTVAEGLLREWLSKFLPKRFGVTSGYIVSAGLKHSEKNLHYDIIIYDVLNSPVLWVEESPDKSDRGVSIAIPVEYVACVLEVKSRFSPKTVTDAIGHLSELKPLMSGFDAPKERYKLHLPPNFICGLVFFELMKKDEFKLAALDRLVSGCALRTFFGGVILRADGHDKPLTGILRLLRRQTPIQLRKKQSLFSGVPIAKSVRIADDTHISASVTWAEANFAQFGFDLIAMMQGTFDPGLLSSFYGQG